MSHWDTDILTIRKYVNSESLTSIFQPLGDLAEVDRTLKQFDLRLTRIIQQKCAVKIGLVITAKRVRTIIISQFHTICVTTKPRYWFILLHINDNSSILY